MFDSNRMNSRVVSDSVGRKERWLGYLIGPQGALTLNMIVGGYINLFYTDVLGLSMVWGGVFLVSLPIISKIITSIMTVFISRWIDRTKSKQGKARPWILISAVLMTLSAILMFWIPNKDLTFQLIWIFISYNFFFSLASSLYSMSHGLMVPLSTRSIKERNRLSIISSIGSNMIAGSVSAIVFALLLLPILRINPALWLPVMSVFAIAVIPFCIIEYFYTYERVTQQSESQTTPKQTGSPKLLSGLFRDKYWWFLMVVVFLNAIVTGVRHSSLIYYCNWVLGTYETGNQIYSLVQMVGGLPMGLGAIFIYPLSKRISRRTLMISGLVLSIIGNVISFLFPTSIPIVVGSQMLLNLGLVPFGYLFSSLFSDVLDHAENISGTRNDGAAIGTDNILKMLGSGLAIGILNATMATFRYLAPDPLLSIQVSQSPQMKFGFTVLFSGAPALGQLIILILMVFLRFKSSNDEKMKTMENTD